MNIEDLIEKAPERLRPIVARYGPALLKMTAEEFCRWIEMLILGRTFQAWQALVEKMDDADLLAAWRAAQAEWDEANARNAEALALQRSVTMAVLKVLLASVLAGAGL